MACACNLSKTKYIVKKPGGAVYKTYTTETEAKAAAKRVGGTVVKQN